MKPRVPRIALWVFLAVLLFAPAAEANVMVPLIFARWLLMIPALIPIILIEAAILTGTGARFWESLLAGSVGNVASTLVGIPLALIVDVVVGISTRFYHDDWSPDWRAPAVGMALLIPFFLLSWRIEAPLVGWVLGEISGMDMAVRDANLVTYAILAILVGGALCFAVVATAQRSKEESKRGSDGARFECPVRARHGQVERRRARENARRHLVVIEGRPPSSDGGEAGVPVCPPADAGRQRTLVVTERTPG